MDANVVVNIILCVLTLAGLLVPAVVGYGKLMTKMGEIGTQVGVLVPIVADLQKVQSAHTADIAVLQAAKAK